MTLFRKALRDPRWLGMACAAGAVMLGLIYLAIAGAPMRYLAINAGALVIGLAMLAAIGRLAPQGERWLGVLTLAAATVLLLTSLFGSSAGGATRWIALAGLVIQPSFVLLPLAIIAFARLRDRLSLAGMLIAAAALALQPDRAMAGMLVAGLAALMLLRPDRFAGVALSGAVTCFAVTLVRADSLPAVPYVEQVFRSAFAAHTIAGLAVLAGSALLLVPAIIVRHVDADARAIHRVFGAVWLSAILAAALGNYPTPVVGYGASAVLGSLLSLSLLPRPGL